MSRATVLLSELRCGLVTVWLLVRGELHLPTPLVGAEVRFADGSISTVYRETVLDAASVAPVVLAVRFRLRLVGLNRVGHAIFRMESLLNTVLFAGHRGFRTKLWLTDLATGFYRGIYEWDGTDAARDYAETLRVVLSPWVQPGTFDYRILGLGDRRPYLEGYAPLDTPAWCRPVATQPTTRPVGA